MNLETKIDTGRIICNKIVNEQGREISKSRALINNGVKTEFIY